MLIYKLNHFVTVIISIFNRLFHVIKYDFILKDSLHLETV